MHKFSIIIFIVFVVLPAWPLSGNEPVKKKILVIHSYHQGLEWTDSISDGIKSVIKGDPGEFEIFFEYLDTKRNPGGDYFKRLIEFEKQKNNLTSLNYDVIISSDNDSLTFLTEEGGELFGETPIIFCGVNFFKEEMLKGNKNITGVPEVIDYRSTLEIMSELHKDQSKMILIIDRTSTGNAIAEELQPITVNLKTASNLNITEIFYSVKWRRT